MIVMAQNFFEHFWRPALDTLEVGWMSQLVSPVVYGFVMSSRIPIMTPNTNIINDEMTVIYNVSPMGPQSSFQISGDSDARNTSQKDESNKLICCLLKYLLHG